MQGMLEKQIGNYRIKSEIASGTFGSVYLAKHSILHDRPPVAIKLLHTHLGSEKEQERFFQEARFLDKLKHPHILPLEDTGLYEGFPYSVVEYAANGTLGDRLDQHLSQPLPIRDALTILSQIAQALQYAHDQNIVHRDLKPANILFNAQGEAVLADFGIAVVLEQTKRVEVEGTPPYMAPEQFQGEVSKRSDQYALGCIAYELLTGRRPFVASDFFAMMNKHLYEQPIPPTKLNPNLPEYVEQAILKAMAKQREDRYSDVSAFVAALQRPLEPTVIEAPPPEKSVKPSPFPKRPAEPTVIEAVVPPKSHKDWLEEGNAFFKLKQYKEAIKAYEEAVQLDPNNAVAYRNKGVALNDLGRYEEAIKAYEEAIQLDPNNAVFYRNRCVALNWLGRYEEAIKAYEEAIQLDPNSAVFYRNKGVALSKLGRYEEAIKACEEAIQLDPNNAVVYRTKGVALNWLGRYEEAIKACEQAIRLDPNNAIAYSNKGYVLGELGRYEEAIRAYEEAIRLDTNLIAARDGKDAVIKKLKKASRKWWW
jgi:serine/threonine protein kinase